MFLKTQSYQPIDYIWHFAVSETAGFRNAISEWRNQQILNRHATTGIVNGFEQCLRGINGLDRTLSYLDDGVILLFGSDIPNKLELHSQALSKIAGHNYLYSGHQASVEIIAKRYSAIRSIVKRLLANGTTNPSGKSSDYHSLQKQVAELKRDFIILAQTELLLLERLLPLFQGISLKQMKHRLQQAQ